LPQASHRPFWHTCVSVQSVPHVPQLVGSLLRVTHVPPQQARSAAPPQPLPQAPQWFLSVCKSTHLSPQRSNPFFSHFFGLFGFF
jgi:hypothetical protein